MSVAARVPREKPSPRQGRIIAKPTVGSSPAIPEADRLVVVPAHNDSVATHHIVAIGEDVDGSGTCQENRRHETRVGKSWPDQNLTLACFASRNLHHGDTS